MANSLCPHFTPFLHFFVSNFFFCVSCFTPSSSFIASPSFFLTQPSKSELRMSHIKRHSIAVNRRVVEPYTHFNIVDTQIDVRVCQSSKRRFSVWRRACIVYNGYYTRILAHIYIYLQFAVLFQFSFKDFIVCEWLLSLVFQNVSRSHFLISHKIRTTVLRRWIYYSHSKINRDLEPPPPHTNR